MAFEKVVPEWSAAGSEPPASLKSGGFTAGYKPPAQYFNWFFTGASEALAELQESAVYSDTLDALDLNSVVETGLYAYTSTCTNRPSSKTGALLVQNYRGTYIVQMSFVHGASDICGRYSSDAGSTWTAWNQFYSTTNKPAAADVGAVTDFGEIAAETDLDTLQDAGFYFVHQSSRAATLVNAPTTKAFFLLVGKHAGTYQRVVEFNTSGAKIYFRNFYYEQGWGSWAREYTTSDMPAPADIGAAASGHKHSASDITSGTLPIARGGTGASTADAALASLGAHSLGAKGTEIASETDLDTINTAGDYYVASATIAATLVNTPLTSSGFRLVVEKGYTSNYVRQYAVGVGTSIFTRYYQTSWSEWEKIITTADSLIFSNKSVASSSFVADSTYADFPYKATITCAGVTSEMFVDVVFAPSDAISGVFAPVALSSSGSVTIYASEKPSAAVTIPTIIARRC